MSNSNHDDLNLYNNLTPNRFTTNKRPTDREREARRAAMAKAYFLATERNITVKADFS